MNGQQDLRFAFGNFVLGIFMMRNDVDAMADALRRACILYTPVYGITVRSAVVRCVGMSMSEREVWGGGRRLCRGARVRRVCCMLGRMLVRLTVRFVGRIYIRIPCTA